MVRRVEVFERALQNASQSPEGSFKDARAKTRRPLKQITKASMPFIRGPIPLRWLVVAISLSRSAARLAVALWYRLGIQGKHVNLAGPQESQLAVRIDRQLRTECQLKRWHVGEGVRDLTSSGLLRVLSGGRGRCPVVEVVVPENVGDTPPGMVPDVDAPRKPPA